MALPMTTRGWKISPEPAPGDGSAALKWVENDPLPPMGESDVLVRWCAWSINYPELAIANGTYPWRPSVPEPIPGSDAAGEVIAVGPRVDSFKPGDKVMPLYYPHFLSGPAPTEETGHGVPGSSAPGVLREFAVMDQRRLALSPKNLSHEETASLPCSALTAWNALYGMQPIKPGDWVLTQGTGGVSMFAVRFAVAAGATVIATTSSEAKAVLLRQMGAHHVIDYRADTKWGETARKLTPRGLGVQHVVDVGGPGTIAQSFEAVARGGVIDVIGFLAGKNQAEEQPSWITPLVRACTVRGVEVGNLEQVADMVRAIEARDIKPVLDSESFTLRQLKEVYKRVWEGRHFGKAVIVGI